MKQQTLPPRNRVYGFRRLPYLIVRKEPVIRVVERRTAQQSDARVTVEIDLLEEVVELVAINTEAVGPNLPTDFAVFAAYGDFATGLLAMLALLTVRWPIAVAVLAGRAPKRTDCSAPMAVVPGLRGAARKRTSGQVWRLLLRCLPRVNSGRSNGGLRSTISAH